MIRVFIVDDHPVVRKGICGLLAEYPDIEVVGESEGGPDVLDVCAALKPEIVLLDIKLVTTDGISICRELRRTQPNIRIIMLTSYDDETYLMVALKSGAQGYLLKSTSPEILVDTLRAVNAGERRISTSLMTAALRSLEQRGIDQIRSVSGLTEEDLQLLHLLADGAGNKEICEKLFVSDRTVKRKLQDLLTKLGAATRAQAVAEGFKRGLL